MKNKDNLNEKRRQESTEKILVAALQVFVEKGFAGASMSQIAKEAQVPQALIYHYFPSKEELWKSVKRDAFLRAHLSKDFGALKAKDAREFVEIALRGRFEFYKKNPNIWRIVQWESLEGEAYNLMGLDNNFEGPWAEELKILQEKGAVHKDVDVKLLGILMRSAFLGVLDDIPKLYKKDSESKQKQYIDLIVDAVATLLKRP